MNFYKTQHQPVIHDRDAWRLLPLLSPWFIAYIHLQAESKQDGSLVCTLRLFTNTSVRYRQTSTTCKGTDSQSGILLLKKKVEAVA